MPTKIEENKSQLYEKIANLKPSENLIQIDRQIERGKMIASKRIKQNFLK